MRNQGLWKPTKFVLLGNKLIASHDPEHIGIRSRFVTNLVANAYQKALQYHANGILLDIGCGTVPLYAIYKNLVQEVICTDWVNTIHDDFYVDVYSDLGKPLPFASDQFDTVLATDVIEHIFNPHLIWSEIARILKPRGKIILGVPFFYWLHEDPYDYFRYTRYSLTLFCKENNLTLIMLEEYGGPFSIILDIIGKNIRNRKFATFFQALAEMLLRTKIGKNIDAHNRHSFPLGYCLVAQKPD